MTPSADPTSPPPVPIRSMGFAVFRLLGPRVDTRVQTSSSIVSSPSTASTLLRRQAGQSVVAETLRLQDDEPPRAWWQRLIGSSPLGADSRPWFHGALGEIAVGRILRHLEPGWTVLHAVPVGSGTSDIDHVLIGPAGVFTLNTKNHSGRKIWVGDRAIFVDGHKQHYLAHARHEAARAAKQLSAAVGDVVPVTPVLVLIEPEDLTIRQRPAGVHVVTDRQLLRQLKRRRPVLTPDQVAQITAAAVLPRTWHSNPAPPDDPVVLQERFAALRESVRSARRRRALWELGLLIGGGAAAVNYGPDLLTALFGMGPV